jgi:teichuronic acid biosynthesis glycosyltransferase TuaC
MNICIISPDYPTSKTISFVFVDQVCKAFSDSGLNVTIIAPQSLTKCIFHKIPIIPFYSALETKKENKITLLRPKIFTLGNLGIRYKLLGRLNNYLFNHAIKIAFKKTDKNFDVIYGHFWNSVYAAYKISKNYNIPLIASSGEEKITIQNNLSNKQINDLKKYLKGVINVSTKNKDECIKAGLCTSSICKVIPNAIDNNSFYKMNQIEQRRLLGFSENIFIVSFVGQFIERKGIHILSQALEMLNDENIYALFLGSGPIAPSYKRTLYASTVPHDSLKHYLNSSDVFVLPTKNEGCSNAIIEAMACGLPIISSDKAFNYDILNQENSLLIDPNDVSAIATAIKKIKDNESLRKTLSNKSLENAKFLTLDERVRKITNFIDSKV